jgi:ribosome-associated protein
MWNDDADDGDFDEWENRRGPSKSSRKRESGALQDLGEELMALAPGQLAQLDLPEPLAEAIRIGRSITAHGALKRQRKFIGKLLRGLDPDPIRTGLALLRHEHVDAVRLQHRCEALRDRLLAEGDPAVNELVGDHPEADRQKLRQLVRDGRRERDEGRPPRAARELFRALRDLLVAPPVGENEGGEEDDAD